MCTAIVRVRIRVRIRAKWYGCLVHSPQEVITLALPLPLTLTLPGS